MKNKLFLLIALFLIAACGTTQPEPTSTPIPPTDTSAPPTPADNPHAEEVLLAFAEAVDNQEYEKATSFFAEDARFKFEDGAYTLDAWLNEAELLEDYYELSEFAVYSDDVEFKSYFRSKDYKDRSKIKERMCEGYATMEQDKIIYIEMSSCEDITVAQAPNPHAEEVLLGFAVAINEKDLESAQEAFTEDASAKSAESTYEGKDEVDEWVGYEIEMHKSFFKFSEFVVEGDNVTFTWFINDQTGKYLCTANATMQEDKISSIEMHDCKEQS